MLFLLTRKEDFKMVERLVNSEANARRIRNVEDCFGTSGISLLKSGRVLVGEGVLTKICRKKPKPRQFFLFNDVLVYGNIVINKKKYNKQHILNLEEIKIVPLEDEGNLRNGWQIISPGKSFAVYAATPTEKAEWMAHINKCINDLLAKTGKKPITDYAAVWVPDSDAPVCMHCKKTKFTAINRRHHCRRCGLVVCGHCSSKKFLLSYISSKPLRVCNSCYEKLDTGTVKATEPASKSEKVSLAHPGPIGSSDSLSRKESENLAESGSSGDEQSDDEEGSDSMQTEPTFYEASKTSDGQGNAVGNQSSKFESMDI